MASAKVARHPIAPAVKVEVLSRCRRRCCMCFGLSGIMDAKDGQIAHLDRNRANNEIENLAYLCLDCHKNYDARSNRVQRYTAGEIRLYRSQLYRALRSDQVEWTLTIRADRSQYVEVKKEVERAHSILRAC